MRAIQSVICIGDEFLRGISSTMKGMKSDANLEKHVMLYLYQQYNFTMHHPRQMPGTRPSIARILNALIKAFNEDELLPKYIIIMPDKDIISSINMFDYGITTLIETNINWLLDQMARTIITRREDLKNKRSGTAPAFLPRVFWVEMLQRPYTTNNRLKNIFAQHNKFNRSLKNILQIEHYMEVISLQNMGDTPFFDAFGELSDMGAHHYW